MNGQSDSGIYVFKESDSGKLRASFCDFTKTITDPGLETRLGEMITSGDLGALKKSVSDTMEERIATLAKASDLQTLREEVQKQVKSTGSSGVKTYFVATKTSSVSSTGKINFNSIYGQNVERSFNNDFVELTEAGTL